MRTITLHFDEKVVFGNQNIDEFPTYGGIYIAFTNFSFLTEPIWKVEIKFQPSNGRTIIPNIKNDYLYIGQSQNIRVRMNQHKLASDIKSPNSFLPVNYCFCPISDEGDRLAAEAVLIHYCVPTLNKKYKSDWNFDENSDFVSNGYDQVRVVLEDKKHFYPNVFGPMKH